MDLIVVRRDDGDVVGGGRPALAGSFVDDCCTELEDPGNETSEHAGDFAVGS